MMARVHMWWRASWIISSILTNRASDLFFEHSNMGGTSLQGPAPLIRVRAGSTSTPTARGRQCAYYGTALKRTKWGTQEECRKLYYYITQKRIRLKLSKHPALLWSQTSRTIPKDQVWHHFESNTIFAGLSKKNKLRCPIPMACSSCSAAARPHVLHLPVCCVATRYGRRQTDDLPQKNPIILG